ncbi:MAG: V-type ATP synthase subunit E [Candidatus Methanoperedens sp.]|nr:V-type ATP synthase subunit E [Candidatus Methanoperedens sp.]MCZ7404971.1 V-type ATP synthase subunit E [Candidatus Methanoperedens sp.]
MGLDAIVEEIKAKGRAEASRISNETSSEVSKILKEADFEAARIKAVKESAVRKEIDRLRQQELSSANLEVKKAILNARKEILDEVYEATKDAVQKLPAEKNLKLLKSIIERNENNNAKIYSRSKDKQTVKKLTKLEYAGEIDCIGGVVIENAEGTEVLDFKYDTILGDVTEQSLKQVSDILFG